MGTPQAKVQPRSMVDKISGPLLWGSAYVFIVCYLRSSLRSAVQTPLWMDEILSVWAMRLPSASQIYSALMHGSEFAPPTFPLLLHYYSKIAGGSNLALRLPSIAAVLFAGFCSFILFRRHLGNASAVFGTCLILEALRSWGGLVRPYAIEAACFAAALVLWDDMNRRSAWWRSALIGLFLALATSLHFYAVLFVPCFGLIELIYILRTHKFRLSLWISLIASGASIFIWLPFIHAINDYNAGDTNGPGYYAHPTLVKLGDALRKLFLADDLIIFMLFAAMFAIAFGKLIGYRDSNRDEKSNERQADFWNLILGTALLPVIIFLFSVVVTKTFNERYAIASIIAMCALITGSLSGSQFFRKCVPLIILFGAFLPSGHAESGQTPSDAILKYCPGPYPIVIADGMQFFPLEETAPPPLRARFVYLTMPPDVPVGDLTNQHQIQRWKDINPELPVEDVNDFLKSHPKFYVLDQLSSDDTPASYLFSKHLIELTALPGGALIYTSRS